MLQGVYPAQKKNGEPYWRASLTHKCKHISLGSYSSEEAAAKAYSEACELLRGEGGAGILDYDSQTNILKFAKWVALVNLRDNGMYCNGPIYLRNRYFEYYLDRTTVLRFSADDLFYYTHHNIQRKGGHLFVADYGLQVSLLSRYGVRSYAVKNRDYYFKNGDETDFRSGNIVIVNRYAGVRAQTIKGRTVYTTHIHVNGDLIVGHYDTEQEAAIAYNKAIDVLTAAGVNIRFTPNYIEDLSENQYRILYKTVKIRKTIQNYVPSNDK